MFLFRLSVTIVKFGLLFVCVCVSPYKLEKEQAYFDNSTRRNQNKNARNKNACGCCVHQQKHLVLLPILFYHDVVLVRKAMLLQSSIRQRRMHMCIRHFLNDAQWLKIVFHWPKFCNFWTDQNIEVIFILVDRYLVQFDSVLITLKLIEDFLRNSSSKLNFWIFLTFRVKYGFIIFLFIKKFNIWKLVIIINMFCNNGIYLMLHSKKILH